NVMRDTWSGSLDLGGPLVKPSLDCSTGARRVPERGTSAHRGRVCTLWPCSHPTSRHCSLHGPGSRCRWYAVAAAHAHIELRARVSPGLRGTRRVRRAERDVVRNGEHESVVVLWDGQFA